MTEWPATIDRRFHDAVFFGLDCLISDGSGGVQARDSSAPLLRRLRDAGVATAVYCTGRDCARSLRAAGLAELVDVMVDGVCGDPKQDVAILTSAANRVGDGPVRCVVVDSEAAGLGAGRDGGFSLVIGLARPDDGRQLRSWGADAVVADPAGISVRRGGTARSDIADAQQVYGQVKALVLGRNPAIFLDFDGTLSEIAAEPACARLIRGAGQALAALAALCPVAVISGRDLSDVRERVGIDGVWYAGSHGFELLAPDGARHQHAAAAGVSDVIARAAERLSLTLCEVPGVAVEPKRFALTVHYRNAAPADVDRVIAAVRAVGRSAGLRISPGRKAVELRPRLDWDKGSTLTWLLEHIEADGRGPVLPLYIGDDLTDEDAFDAIQFDGAGIVVRHRGDGDHPSSALFSLENPAAVVEFLRHLADDLSAFAGERDDLWQLAYDGYDPDTERLREALCTVGNGYVATRGCAPEASANEHHYPGSYAAGVYNQLTDRVAGRTVDNESLVNLPNWLPLTFRINGGPWFHVDNADLLSYRQALDLRTATLTRELRFRDGDGGITRVIQQRFASMHECHVLAMRTTVVAENWSGTIEFESLIDGSVRNTLVERYRSLSSGHLVGTVIDDIAPDATLLCTHTSQSRLSIAVAARNSVWCDQGRADARYASVRDGDRGGHRIAVDVSAGRSVTLEKVAVVVTSRDAAITQPGAAAQRYLDAAGRYDELHREHARAWGRLWQHFAIGLADGTTELAVLRLHIVHLLQTISPHTAEIDAGVPARGLHGEAYRGHVFWDALFVSPVLGIRMPNVARSLLLYRYRRLPEARRAARRAGHLGAMYPWQSGSDGHEVSQELHLNPQSGHWNPDPSARAHHVGLAIAYNVWQHYQVTGDRQWLIDYGAEMLVEIARFWSGLAKFDEAHGRYVIRGIIGPDEFHSGYPGKEYDGIDNNAYTNVMAVWAIMRALDAMELLPLRDRLDLVAKVDLTETELDRWDHVTRRMFVPFHDGVISQFEGYCDLEELDWPRYRQRYGNIRRLDRILEAEGDSVNNYRASKQADALMLFYLLSSDVVLELFGRIGYRFAPEQIPATVQYYLSRTSHGSTLSAVVHSWVLARANRHLAMDFFHEVLDSDIADIQGGTTAEGIHLAAVAGSVDLLQRCFTGLETRDDRLIVSPHWPDALGAIEFPLVYRGQRLHLRVSGRGCTLTSEAGNAAPITVEYRWKPHRLAPGHTVELT